MASRRAFAQNSPTCACGARARVARTYSSSWRLALRWSSGTFVEMQSPAMRKYLSHCAELVGPEVAPLSRGACVADARWQPDDETESKTAAASGTHVTLLMIGMCWLRR